MNTESYDLLPARLAAVVVATIFTSSLSFVLADEPVLDEVIKRHLAAWDRVSTSWVRADKRSVSRTALGEQNVSASSLYELLEELWNHREKEDVMRVFTEWLASHELALRDPISLEIHTDRNKIANLTHDAEGELLRHSAFNGAREAQYFADSGQVNLYDGRSHIRFHDPSHWVTNVFPVFFEDCTIVDVSDERVVVRKEIRFDTEDGIFDQGFDSISCFDLESGLRVQNFEIEREKARKVNRKAVFCGGVQRREGGVYFPGLRVEASVSDGLVTKLKMFDITDAEFNQPIDPDVFSVSVPKGVVAVNGGMGAPSRGNQKLRDDMDDATTVLAGTGAPDPPSGLKVWPILIGLMFVTSGIAIMWLIRRRS